MQNVPMLKLKLLADILINTFELCENTSDLILSCKLLMLIVLLVWYFWKTLLYDSYMIE